MRVCCSNETSRLAGSADESCVGCWRWNDRTICAVWLYQIAETWLAAQHFLVGRSRGVASVGGMGYPGWPPSLVLGWELAGALRQSRESSVQRGDACRMLSHRTICSVVRRSFALRAVCDGVLVKRLAVISRLNCKTRSSASVPLLIPYVFQYQIPQQSASRCEHANAELSSVKRRSSCKMENGSPVRTACSVWRRGGGAVGSDKSIEL